MKEEFNHSPQGNSGTDFVNTTKPEDKEPQSVRAVANNDNTEKVTTSGSEFNLSDDIVSEKAIRSFKGDSGKSWIEDKKVKEFIKNLKEANYDEWMTELYNKNIDKLAGKDLT